MAKDDEEADKSHEPTQRKLDEARKKGEIARSPDLMTVTGYAGILLVALLIGQATIFGFGDALMPFIDHPDLLADQFFQGSATVASGELILAASLPILPWVALPGAMVLLVLIAMRALLFTPSKVTFKASRLSLIENAKNKFGRRGLFEFAKSFVKLAVYSVALALFLMVHMQTIAGSLQGGPTNVVRLIGTLTIQMMTIVVMIAAIIGVIDFFWQRQEHLRRNRMSHKEMRDEFKETEGDPAMKQQRRARAQDIATNQMMLDVPKADVILVNPTHYAVALKWDRAAGQAPVCVAKGVDEVAARIREVAAQTGIPIHSDPPTARSLHAGVEIGQQITPDHYRPVAAAIRFAESMRERARKRGR